jgi:hypothetical protein
MDISKEWKRDNLQRSPLSLSGVINRSANINVINHRILTFHIPFVAKNFLPLVIGDRGGDEVLDILISDQKGCNIAGVLLYTRGAPSIRCKSPVTGFVSAPRAGLAMLLNRVWQSDTNGDPLDRVRRVRYLSIC